MSEAMPERLAAALASWGRVVSDVLPLGGGANSRVFVMTDESGERFCAKLHHLGEDGDSQRYHREKNFYAAVRDVGSPWMVQDMRWDDAQNVGFLEYVEGASVESPSREDAQQAGEFICALQQVKVPGLEGASESALQPEMHVGMVDRRLDMMQTIADADAAALVTEQLRPAWEKVRSEIRPSEAIPIVSPSDFGFHN
ncbi:MAG: phosphotransferase, partial [Akkermansiaceae bacterium]